jgi:acyl carrier protein
MNADQARKAILESIHAVAPEVDPGEIEPDEELREQLDIDSMDFLNVIVGIHERTGIDVPEADYEHLETLDGAIKYLVRVSRG